MADKTPRVDEEETEIQTTDAEDRAVKKCADWFLRDRSAKQSYVDEMEEMDKLYRGDHWDLIGPAGTVLRNPEQQKVHPNSVENVAFALIEGFVSEFAQPVDLIDYPVEKEDEEVATTMTDLKQFILYKNRFLIESQKFRRHLFKYGTGVLHTYWDPDWQGGRGPNRWLGDIRIKALHPQSVFPDARCKEDVNEGTRFHKARYVPLEYIRERYPEYGELVHEESIDDSMLVGEDDDDSDGESRIGQAVLIETWYRGRPLILGKGEKDLGPGLHVIWWANESQHIYLKHANYVYFEPGEDAKLPFIIRQCYPRENSIWGYGEAFFIKSPQIALNKTAEMILEGHMHHALGQTFYEAGGVTDDQEEYIKKFGTLAGMWFAVQDINKIQRYFGQGVPASLQEEVIRLQKAMENILGRYDISQGRTPGTVTAFRALDLLAQRAQARLRSKDVALNTAYEDVGNYMNNLITKFYTEERAYRVIGEDERGKPTITRRGVFRLEDIQKVYVFDPGEVLPKQQFQPDENMVEGEHYEIYSPEMDVVARTSTSMPSDRMFYMEVAKELYAKASIDLETFFYVMQNGKFPPYEELAQKMQADQTASATPKPPTEQIAFKDLPPAGKVQMAAHAGIQLRPDDVAAPLAPPPGVIANQPDIQSIVSQLPPDVQAQLQGLPPEQQMALLQQLAGGGSSGPQG